MHNGDAKQPREKARVDFPALRVYVFHTGIPNALFPSIPEVQIHNPAKIFRMHAFSWLYNNARMSVCEMITGLRCGDLPPFPTALITGLARPGQRLNDSTLQTSSHRFSRFSPPTPNYRNDPTTKSTRTLSVKSMVVWSLLTDIFSR